MQFFGISRLELNERVPRIESKVPLRQSLLLLLCRRHLAFGRSLRGILSRKLTLRWRRHVSFVLFIAELPNGDGIALRASRAHVDEVDRATHASIKTQNASICDKYKIGG